MSEGEIKKRINMIVEKQKEIWKNNEYANPLYVKRDDIFQILEDTKNEFPKFEDCITNEEWEKAVEEWFKKQFGETKK